ncbi:MAG: DUF5908 family protein [Bacteroidetes bacterium]|nr:DUF5908 family protein [Bacteroidota bacterium]MCL6103354.1 DUF5908 family protein [Bacteroidota bacterium]
MPVIIDEVVINVEVTNPDSGGATSSSSPPEEKQAIVSECVERVLEILKQKTER